MDLDPARFHAILADLLEESPLACRGALQLAAVEFTDEVPTAAVTLAARPRLQVNLGFLAAQCATEEHVKAVLLHEFLHVLLRHSLDFREMTPALGFALDVVINAIIHRWHGEPWSSFFSRYYADAGGPFPLLRPPPDDVRRQLRVLFLRPENVSEKTVPDASLRRLDPTWAEMWFNVYQGTAVAEDVLELARQFNTDAVLRWLQHGPLLLGNHAPGPALDLDDLEPFLAEQLRNAAARLPQILWRDPRGHQPGPVNVPPVQPPEVQQWERAVERLLRPLVTPDPRGARLEHEPLSLLLPVLHAGDRRGFLRAQWNPLVPDITWSSTRPRAAGSVQVYLDVSGSMNTELQALVPLLSRLGRWIRRPFWAFSTEISPARIDDGRLRTQSTGGTALACVLEHLRRTRPQKALIITDGFVERLSSEQIAAARGQRIEVLLSRRGTDQVLRPTGWPIHRLPGA